MHTLLPELARTPSSWEEKSKALFRNTGSFGNGSAMRVAPLGAYFADDLEAVCSHAEYSSVITHSHPEGVAGAIAVAVAAALACQHGLNSWNATDFLHETIQHTPMSEVQLGIVKAAALPVDTPVKAAVRMLGSGARVSAQDAVPFCLWVAAHHLDSYQEALWTTVSGLGDRDTTCAIVGGIVVMSAGIESIPRSWLASRESIPVWFLNTINDPD